MNDFGDFFKMLIRNLKEGADPVFVCPHIAAQVPEHGNEPRRDMIPGEKLPVMCVHHPDTGLLCKDCFNEQHIGRAHDDALCEICGLPATTWSFQNVWEVRRQPGIPIRTTTMQSFYSGSLLLLGKPVCSEHGDAITAAVRDLTP